MADPTNRPRRIRYMLDNRHGAPKRDQDDTNNPLSQNFMPLAERTEHQKARWWALYGRKRRFPGVEFDSGSGEW